MNLGVILGNIRHRGATAILGYESNMAKLYELMIIWCMIIPMVLVLPMKVLISIYDVQPVLRTFIMILDQEIYLSSGRYIKICHISIRHLKRNSIPSRPTSDIIFVRDIRMFHLI